ncbi:MAG: dTDP-4-dehydrorhamnose reductase [Oscillospiraceae bacterium]|nr:dTDP-4-dehydrorhamnose reductase [Oscillospiraceae bacterium]
MKILITGGKGQLGTELAKCFERGYTEIGTPEVLKGTNEVRPIDIDELDITDLSQVRALMRSGGYDAVINCAAYTNVDGCETHRDDAFKVNAIGPRNLAMVCEETGAKLIHVSTDYVFSGNASAPQTECDIPAPKSAYGSTKYMGERYVREFCSRSFIVRTAWLYGYYGKNFVKTIMNAARKYGALTVVDDQIGNPTNAADLAHHIIKLLDTEEYGIYHGTGTGICSWYDFASEIVRLAGIDAKVSPCTSAQYAADHPAAADRPAYSALDNMMFRVTVGDEFRPWQEALTEFFKNYSEQEN